MDEFIQHFVSSFLVVMNRPDALREMFAKMMTSAPDQKVYTHGALRDDGKWCELKVTFDMTVSNERPQPSAKAIEAIQLYIAEHE